ncbi:MAG: hypothetical protein INH41_25450 [Myxococcaceae bacterium]|jgi:hypothetical protein|nr:hypothetical protein [Myxococcaceae bacterium]
MTSEQRALVALTVLAAGCQPLVSVGRDDELGFEGACGVTEATVECPGAPWGAPVTFDGVPALQARRTRRWAFCGGEQRYTGRQPLAGFYGGAGVEFWDDGGQLRFAFLRGAGAFTRRTEASATGTAQLFVEGGRARAVLTAGDGVAAPWALELFDQPPVLQNSAFDVWRFVAAP